MQMMKTKHSEEEPDLYFCLFKNICESHLPAYFTYFFVDAIMSGNRNFSHKIDHWESVKSEGFLEKLGLFSC